MNGNLDVQGFGSYRSFLIAHAQHMKSKRPNWSFGAWSRALELKSTSSITKVIHGEREPGQQITEKLVRYFNFTDKQARYFRDLVRMEKIKDDPRLLVLLLEKMQRDSGLASFRLLDDKNFIVISNWYCLAIRELARIQGFKEDPTWISKRFHFEITAREVTQALKALLSAGLLSRKKNGRLVIQDGRLDTANDIASEAVKRYHEQMLTHARVAIRSIPVREREITAVSLPMNAAKMDSAKELIRDFKLKFESLMEDVESGDQVYQLQIQLFPLTRKSERKNL